MIENLVVSPPLPKVILRAHTLFFDGAYSHNLDKVAREIVILSPSKEVVLKKGIAFKDAHSNNKAKYATLIFGLKECTRAMTEASR